MEVNALVPYFGCARMIAEHVGKALEGCTWVGVPFAGGMPELKHITARTIVVNDLHWHVINLACVLADDAKREGLLEWWSEQLFHPATLEQSQRESLAVMRQKEKPELGDVVAARWYFVSQWMGRSAKAGTKDEFKGNLPVRWTDSGGDSNTRYRSAVASMDEWGVIMRRCNFTVTNAFDFLGKCHDEANVGIYVDAPWPEDGDSYLFPFTTEDQKRLVKMLLGFKNATIVVRFGDHPLIRELYTEVDWEWEPIEGRTQANATKSEVLLHRRRTVPGGKLF